MSDQQPPSTPAAPAPGIPDPVVVEIEVRYAETDAMGLVHHSRYLPWMEIARTRLCAATGYPYAEIERMGYRLVVTGAELRYLRGARYGDEVAVECRLTRLGSRGMHFEYTIRRQQELLATGATEHVWTQAATGRPCRMPEVLRPGFERLSD